VDAPSAQGRDETRRCPRRSADGRPERARQRCATIDPVAFGRASKKTGDQAAPSLRIPAARPADWPAVNTEVVIVLPREGGIFRTKVRAHDRLNGQFLLALAGDATKDALPASPGDELMATWTSPAGLHELKTEVVDAGENDPTWKVEPTSPVIVHERRRFPRVRRTGAIQLEAGSKALAATMLDLSEGGARCVIDAVQMVEPDLVSTTLNLDNKAIKIRGWVAWKKQRGKHTELGISFAGLSAKDAEALRSYVLAMQKFQQRSVSS